MNIGFTGTSAGMTRGQAVRLRNWLTRARARATDRITLHHGDCIEADAAAHQIGRELGFLLIIHPPLDPKKRAWCQGDMVLPEREYLARNRDIVDATDMLVAAPDGPERPRSGTWSTIRYARRLDRRVAIIYPGQE